MADYRVEDLLMIERWRMWSAMAFIKSGGTLFPTRPPRLPTSRTAVSWALTALEALGTTASPADSAIRGRISRL